MQRLDDVDARLLLVVWGNRVLEIEHHDIGAKLGGLLEHPDVATGNGELAAVKTGACGAHEAAVDTYANEDTSVLI